MMLSVRPRVAIVARDMPLDLDQGRFRGVAAALAGVGLEPVACSYDEAREGEVERQLNAGSAALVWVNPEHEGRSRQRLNALLRRVAASGVFVSAHPDVIDRIGVKEVLARTRDIGWSGDAWYYRTEAELRAGLPVRLAAGTRVLKQNRGHSGLGVWRVEALDAQRVRIVAATDRTTAREVLLEEFLADRGAEIDAVDGFVDQAFQHRLGDGMIRCYLSGAKLAGFGWHKVRALLDPDDVPTPARTYTGPDDPRFQVLRERMERAWTPALLRLLGLTEEKLPLLWDADFLFGPIDADGRDSYVLCEINASSVSPMPEEAAIALARGLQRRLSSG